MDPSDQPRPIDRLRWVLTTEHTTVRFLREFLVTVLIVAAAAGVLFAISGVWPPMVAIESGSMEPNMHRGDLVILVAPGRFGPGSGAEMIVPHADGEAVAYEQFGDYGDVIVYRPHGARDQPLIIHRAKFWVEEGEDWTARADPDFLGGADCAVLEHCPAPHDGYITKGDANSHYDQVTRISSPVKSEWVDGRAIVRIPWLGYVRLFFTEVVLGTIHIPATSPGAA